MMAMSYGYVYVAQVAMGADPNQTLKAIREAALPLAQAGHAAPKPVPGLVASLRSWRSQAASEDRAPAKQRQGIAVVSITRHGIVLAGRVVSWPRS